LAGVLNRLHRPVDEHDREVSDLALVLDADESVEEPFPLRHVGRDIRDPAILQEIANLRSGQTLAGIGKHLGDGLKMLSIERRNLLVRGGHARNYRGFRSRRRRKRSAFGRPNVRSSIRNPPAALHAPTADRWQTEVSVLTAGDQDSG
jgi:hypothetical protein